MFRLVEFSQGSKQRACGRRWLAGRFFVLAVADQLTHCLDIQARPLLQQLFQSRIPQFQQAVTPGFNSVLLGRESLRLGFEAYQRLNDYAGVAAPDQLGNVL